MSSKTPIRTVFNDSGVATGLAEFQTGEFIPLSHGGIGAALSIGGAGQVLKVNSGGTALEFGAVEAIVNIDGATDLTSATLVATDKLLLSDGGTEGRVNLSQIDTLFAGTTQTLTNKTLTTPTISSIVNSGTLTLPTSTDTIVGRATTDTLTNKTISGSSSTLSNIGNSSLTNSAVTVGTTSISLGGSATTIAGVSDLTAGSINIAAISGGAGGMLNQFNNLTTSPVGSQGLGPNNRYGITQSFSETNSGLSGSITRTISSQEEFYTGEFSGSTLIISRGELNEDCEQFKEINPKGATYRIRSYRIYFSKFCFRCSSIWFWHPKFLFIGIINWFRTCFLFFCKSISSIIKR